MDVIYPAIQSDVFARLTQDYPEFKKYWFSSVGKVVSFGHYTIGNYSDPDRSDEISWIVLAKKGNTCLLISQEILDYQPYHQTNDLNEVPWAQSWLRTWLNRDFYNNAFSDLEKAALAENHIAQRTSTGAGSIPFCHDAVNGDKVYILSEKEAEEYFRSKDDIDADATRYAQKLGLKTTYRYSATRASWWPYDTNGPHSRGDWWFRTRTGLKDCLWRQVYLYSNRLNNGNIYLFKDRNQKSGVRPVISVNLDSEYFNP